MNFNKTLDFILFWPLKLFIAFILTATVFSSTIATEIPLEIVEPSQRTATISDYPVSVGIIIPEGEISSANAPGGKVKDDLNNDIGFQYKVTGYWQDGSVKWLLLQFNASTNRQYRFSIESATFSSGTPIAFQVSAPPLLEKIYVSTGAVDAEISITPSTSSWGIFTFNNNSMLLGATTPQKLTVYYQGNPIQTTYSETSCTIEEGNGNFAVIKREGDFVNGGITYASQITRMKFFKNESFVKIYHTFIWKKQDLDYELDELSLSFKPNITAANYHLGLSDYTNSKYTRTATSNPFVAYQSGPSSFTVKENGTQISSGTKLGGWIAMEDSSGKGVGISLRHAWQTYPTTLGIEDGEIKLGLWPAEADLMGFEYADLIPEPIFSLIWPDGNPVHQHETYYCFMHTPEGAAKTHEITLFFYDAQSDRTIDELNSLNQHPIAIRQDPQQTMSYKHLGFKLSYKDDTNFPVIENALETLGRMSAYRQEDLHSYGFWRFGMTNFGTVLDGLYRWFNGTQYAIQLVPWLMWMRGGDRYFFEQAQIQSQYAQDVCVNHYNTRGVPPGYMSRASESPFPIFNLFFTKHIKLQFMSLDYHLTGNPRAKSVFDTVKSGMLWAIDNERPGADDFGFHAREFFNISRTWAHIYMDDGYSSTIRAHADTWFNTTFSREYDSTLKMFRNPPAYIYESIAQQLMFQNNPTINSTIIDHIAATGQPELADGGFFRSNSVKLAPWLYEQTSDERYLKILWDVTRQMADYITPHDWTSSEDIEHFMVWGNRIYREGVLPILIGQAVAQERGYTNDTPPMMKDTHISIAPAVTGKHSTYFRAIHDGDIDLNISLAGRQSGLVGQVTATIKNPQGQTISTNVIDGSSYPTIVDEFYPMGFFTWRDNLTISNAVSGDIYTIDFATQTSNPQDVCAYVWSDNAQVVQHIPNGTWIDSNQFGARGPTSGRFFMMATGTSAVFTVNPAYPFAVRDAANWNLMFQSPIMPSGAQTVTTQAGQKIALINRGYFCPFTPVSGMKPYIATSGDQLFDPEVQQSIFKHDFENESFDAGDNDRDPNSPSGSSPVWYIYEDSEELITVTDNTNQALRITSDSQGSTDSAIAQFSSQTAGLFTARCKVKFNTIQTSDPTMYIKAIGAGGLALQLRARPEYTTGSGPGFHTWTRNPDSSMSIVKLIDEIRANETYQLVIQFDMSSKTFNFSIKNLDSNDAGQSAKANNIPFYNAGVTSIYRIQWAGYSTVDVEIDDINVNKD